MKRVYLIIGIALAVAVLVTTGLVQSTVFANNQQLPYQAGGPENVILEVPHPDCGPGKLKVEVQGSGQGTYFGAYTIVRHHCFTISDGSITDGYFEQTAANGDMAWGTYAGSFAGVLEADENGVPTVIMIQAPWEITGGTGRFAGAEGAGEAVGVFDLVNETGEFTMEGWISFDASN